MQGVFWRFGSGGFLFVNRYGISSFYASALVLLLCRVDWYAYPRTLSDGKHDNGFKGSAPRAASVTPYKLSPLKLAQYVSRAVYNYQSPSTVYIPHDRNTYIDNDNNKGYLVIYSILLGEKTMQCLNSKFPCYLTRYYCLTSWFIAGLTSVTTIG